MAAKNKSQPSKTSAFSDNVTQLQNQYDTQQKTIIKLEARIEQLELKQRNHNLIIEGIMENNEENLIAIINEMLQDL